MRRLAEPLTRHTNLRIRSSSAQCSKLRFRRDGSKTVTKLILQSSVLVLPVAFSYNGLQGQVSVWWALRQAPSGTQSANGFRMKPDPTTFTGTTYASLAAKIHSLSGRITAVKV